MRSLLDPLCDLAVEAGRAILAVYDGPIAVVTKDDRSPLTEADRAAHRVIAAGLARLAPDIPILSEEGRPVPYGERRHWHRLWIVDPLDGTKEFIKRNGEFTVNIALVERGAPVVGVVYAPVPDLLYWSLRGAGAWRRTGNGPAAPIRVRDQAPARGLTVVQSRSHPSPDLAAYMAGLPVAETLSRGSSLKLCAVAEGAADLYPRLGPTMEWDTAAGHAVVEGAGGAVRTPAGQPLRYNKPDLLNPHFIVTGGATT